jgi:hypothetical protein
MANGRALPVRLVALDRQTSAFPMQNVHLHASPLVALQ